MNRETTERTHHDSHDHGRHSHEPGHRAAHAHGHAAGHEHGHREQPGGERFVSTVPYEAARIRAAAIYCSDGRMGEHFDEFLHTGLKLPRYDRVALPGGPANLADHPQAHLHAQGVADELKFLIEVHGLRKVVLLAHEGCAFYTTRLELKERRLELLQRADLIRAAAFVRRVTGLDAVEAYFAHQDEGRVWFEGVEV